MQGEAFGVRQRAAAFKNAQNFVFHLFIESGSELPHSEGALRAQKVLGTVGRPREPAQCYNDCNNFHLCGLKPAPACYFSISSAPLTKLIALAFVKFEGLRNVYSVTQNGFTALFDLYSEIWNLKSVAR